MELKEMAMHGFRVAKNIIEEGGEAMPVFLVEGPGGELGVILTPWKSDGEKAATFKMMRAMFAEKGIKSYVFVSECWVTKCDKGEEWDGTMPSENPNRLDVLIVDAHTREGESYSLMVEVDSLPGGKRAITKEPENLDTGFQEGRAVNLLMPEAPAQARH